MIPQGEILKQYADSRKLTVAQVSRDLGIDRPRMYAIFKTETFSKKTIDKINEAYPDFMEFQSKLIRSIIDNETVKNEKDTKEAIELFKEMGYDPEHPTMTVDELYTMVLSTASQVSFLVEERMKDKNYSGDLVSEAIRAHTRRIETALKVMREFDLV